MTHADHDSTHNAGRRSCSPVPSPVTSRSPRSNRPLPTTAAPATRTFFDPWNSSSTGHQRAENRLSGSTSWRASRNLKLGKQYQGGLTGGDKRVADTVGAGSEDFGKDGRKSNGGWEKGAKGLRTDGQQSLMEVWTASKSNETPVIEKELGLRESEHGNVAILASSNATLHDEGKPEYPITEKLAFNIGEYNEASYITSEPANRQIFAGLCFYTNGSTAPLISDYRLKHMLAAHGATHSIALGRRSVTHVILGTPSKHGGAGGGLAATKIQKEIARTRGKAVKFVTAEWVLESIKAQTRLPESRFSPMDLAPKSQRSVFGMSGTNPGPQSERDQG